MENRRRPASYILNLHRSLLTRVVCGSGVRLETMHTAAARPLASRGPKCAPLRWFVIPPFTCLPPGCRRGVRERGSGGPGGRRWRRRGLLRPQQASMPGWAPRAAAARASRPGGARGLPTTMGAPTGEGEGRRQTRTRHRHPPPAGPPCGPRGGPGGRRLQPGCLHRWHPRPAGAAAAAGPPARIQSRRGRYRMQRNGRHEGWWETTGAG
jgi:hypothetical protein